MKQEKYSSLSLDVLVNVPADAAEFDTLAERIGACVDEANSNIVYRGVLAEVRDILIHGVDPVKDPATGNVVRPGFDGLEKITGISRKTKNSGRTKKVKVTVDGAETEREESVLVYDESEADYVKRVAAAKGWGSPDTDTYKQALQPLMDQVAALVVFDPKERERKPAQPKKLPDTYRNTATKLVEAGKWDALAAKLLRETNTVLGDQPDDKAKAIEQAGWAIKANEDAKRKQAEAEYTNV
jgi:hypothetical protein